jgi:arsenate reductase
MNHNDTIHLYSDVAAFIATSEQQFGQIPVERKDELQQVADYVRKRLRAGATPKLTFICTHNSRRSHLSQIWAKIAADHYQLNAVETFSGGTESTAFNPRAVESLKRRGLKITTEAHDTENPIYLVSYADGSPTLRCFSKVFNAPPNPTEDYCAVMTCSQADDACPVVMGCDLRAPIRYEDPKVADDTTEEAATYDARSQQICREMLYLMSQV